MLNRKTNTGGKKIHYLPKLIQTSTSVNMYMVIKYKNCELYLLPSAQADKISYSKRLVHPYIIINYN